MGRPHRPGYSHPPPTPPTPAPPIPSPHPTWVEHIHVTLAALHVGAPRHRRGHTAPLAAVHRHRLHTHTRGGRRGAAALGPRDGVPTAAPKATDPPNPAPRPLHSAPHLEQQVVLLLAPLALAGGGAALHVPPPDVHQLVRLPAAAKLLGNALHAAAAAASASTQQRQAQHRCVRKRWPRPWGQLCTPERG